MPTFSFGAAFDRFFKLFGQNFALFAVIGLIGNVAPILAASFYLSVYLHLIPGGWSERFQNPTAESFWIVLLVSAGVGAINLIGLSMITETAILRAVGKKVRLGEIFVHGVTNILPLFGQYIQIGLTVGLGFILLIIPGIFWAICTWVAVPAYVGQPGLGVSGAYTRSFELTKGHRWSLFLIGLVLVGVNFVTAIGLNRALRWLGMPDLAQQLIAAGYNAFATLIGNIFTV
ncbi:MAG: hypothetical protein JF571_13745, partial [Asticcacaulis sp.]|nr:hypothetical protein [Asticcacaulis sp.]